MSYILDALKRADAERERGAVPGLHTQAGLHSSDAPVRTARLHPGLWLGAAATVGAVAAAVLLWPAAGPAPAVVRVAAPASPRADTPSGPVTVAAAPAMPLPTPPTAQETERSPSPPPLPTVERKRSSELAAAPRADTRPLPMAAAPQVSIPARSTATETKAASAAPATPPAELSEELRRQLPAIQITGVVYSDNPGQRLLLVNGQVLPQGSTLAPDLSLEEIGQRSSVFKFRGVRFKVAHGG